MKEAAPYLVRWCMIQDYYNDSSNRDAVVMAYSAEDAVYQATLRDRSYAETNGRTFYVLSVEPDLSTDSGAGQ